MAYLMKLQGASALDALSALQKPHPAAQPNAGFMRQLQLWATMGCRLDERHPAYRRFRMEQVILRTISSN